MRRNAPGCLLTAFGLAVAKKRVHMGARGEMGRGGTESRRRESKGKERISSRVRAEISSPTGYAHPFRLHGSVERRLTRTRPGRDQNVTDPLRHHRSSPTGYAQRWHLRWAGAEFNGLHCRYKTSSKGFSTYFWNACSHVAASAPSTRRWSEESVTVM